MKSSLKCFKAYDVRGKLGEEINEGIVYKISQSIVQKFNAKNVVIGFDARESSSALAKASELAICDAGADALKIGLVGSEEMYWAVSELKADAGIMITASHNPINFNGMKIVKAGAQPLSEKEFFHIKQISEDNVVLGNKYLGAAFDKRHEAHKSYINKILSFVNVRSLKPLKIVINSGNGPASLTIDALEKQLKNRGVLTNFVRLNDDINQSSLESISNPIPPKNHSTTSEFVRTHSADFGVEFDGDFDRCFLFDHQGNFISGEWLIGLLAEIFLNKEAFASIVHDTRVVWNLDDVIKKYKGNPISSRAGHVYMKNAMRKSNAIYGGELSAHHYFRDFNYSDSGMIPWLLIWELISKKGLTLEGMLSKRKQFFISSGEKNFKASSSSQCFKKIKKFFIDKVKVIDEIDGLSMNFENWRFNLRFSKTEDLLRLNLESRGDQHLLNKKLQILSNLITDS